MYDGARHKEFTWGGRIAENVVQALSRLVVTDAILRIEADPTLDANVVLTVHDEIVLISQANNPDVTMDKLIAHMCTNPIGRKTYLWMQREDMTLAIVSEADATIGTDKEIKRENYRSR